MSPAASEIYALSEYISQPSVLSTESENELC